MPRQVTTTPLAWRGGEPLSVLSFIRLSRCVNVHRVYSLSLSSIVSPDTHCTYIFRATRPLSLRTKTQTASFPVHLKPRVVCTCTSFHSLVPPLAIVLHHAPTAPPIHGPSGCLWLNKRG